LNRTLRIEGDRGWAETSVDGVPFVTFIPVVIITTLISGFGAGLFCTVVSTALASFFVLPPSW